MKYLRYFIFFLVVSLNTSCEKEIDVDLPRHDSKLTINCNLLSGEIPEATISHSLNSLDPISNFKTLSEATVILFENNIAVDTLLHYNNISDDDWNWNWYNYNAGIFKGDYIIKSGKNYKVEASHSNHETAFGETICPSNFIEITEIDISGLKIDSMEYYMEESAYSYYRTGKVKFKLTGPLNNDLHYFISVFDEDKEINAFGITSQNQLIITEEKNISEDGSIYPSQSLYISGSNGNLNNVFTINVNPNGPWGYEDDITDGIELRIEAQSDEYFQFKQKVIDYNNSDGNPFSEMVFLPNNITGGYGFISGGAVQKTIVP